MQESVAIAWCDNGMVDGKFMQGVTDVLLKSGITFNASLRSQGNQIARQRQKVIEYWYDKTDNEWLLWVDSDVVISPETFKLLWDNKDAKERPMVTGVYFLVNLKKHLSQNLLLQKRKSLHLDRKTNGTRQSR
jgi:hypothetical protein